MRDVSAYSPSELARITFTWERVRGVLLGCVETIWQPGATIALLVAIRYFHADETIKSIIIGAKFLGFMLTPFSLSLFARTGVSKTRLMCALFFLTGLFLGGSSFSQSLFIFAAFTMLAEISFVQYLPLNTQLYAAHFTTDQRGHRMSTLFLIAVLVGGVGGLVIGELLDHQLEYFRWVLRFASLAAIGCGLCLLQIPSRPLERSEVGSFWNNLSLVRHDRMFATMLGAWMLLGLGNLMTLPLRMELLANPEFGINASNRTILIVMAVIPLGAKLITTKLLGRLFDRLNLITMRVMLNLLLLSSMLVFFSTRRIEVMALGMALLGVGMAGGRILWTLWVTKLAPPGKSSAYMSIHMMCTGLRGVAAPFIGYALIRHLGFFEIALLGSGMTLLATVLFLPMKSRIQQRSEENLQLETPS